MKAEEKLVAIRGPRDADLESGFDSPGPRQIFTSGTDGEQTRG
jgi:hypothetical protein